MHYKCNQLGEGSREREKTERMNFWLAKPKKTNTKNKLVVCFFRQRYCDFPDININAMSNNTQIFILDNKISEKMRQKHHIQSTTNIGRWRGKTTLFLYFHGESGGERESAGEKIVKNAQIYIIFWVVVLYRELYRQ